MSIEVAWNTVAEVSGRLHHAALGIVDSAGTAVEGVDAGEATAIVAGLVARLVESAAGLCEGLEAASQGVRESGSILHASDLEIGTDLRRSSLQP